MKKTSIVKFGLPFVVLLMFPVGAWAQDSDSDKVDARITLAETVYIDINVPTVNFGDVTEDDIIAGQKTVPDAIIVEYGAITNFEVIGQVTSLML